MGVIGVINFFFKQKYVLIFNLRIIKQKLAFFPVIRFVILYPPIENPLNCRRSGSSSQMERTYLQQENWIRCGLCPAARAGVHGGGGGMNP